MQLNRFIFALILATLFWAPLPIGSDRQWAWSFLGFLIFLTTALSLFFSKTENHIALNNYPALQRYSYWFALAAFPLVAAIQLTLATVSATNLDYGQAIDTLLRSLALICFGYLLLRHITSRKRLKAVIYTMVIAGLIQAVYGTLLLFSDLKLSPVLQMHVDSRATGSFVYKNHLANFLLLTVSMGTGLLISQFKDDTTSSWKFKTAQWLKFILGTKMLLRLALIVIVGALVLTKSRMGNSAFFFALMITSLIALLWFKNKPKVFIWFVLSILAIDILLIGSWVGMDKVQKRLEETVLTEEGRLGVIEDGLPALKDAPLLGQGAGSFYSAFNRFQSQDVGGFYDHAHNDYLQFTFEYGFIATLLSGAGLLFILYQNVQTMRKRRSRLYQGIAYGCFMAIIAMLIHCTVDFNLQAPANALYFITILALSLCCSSMPRAGWYKQSRRSHRF